MFGLPWISLDTSAYMFHHAHLSSFTEMCYHLWLGGQLILVCLPRSQFSNLCPRNPLRPGQSGMVVILYSLSPLHSYFCLNICSPVFSPFLLAWKYRHSSHSKGDALHCSRFSSQRAYTAYPFRGLPAYTPLLLLRSLFCRRHLSF